MARTVSSIMEWLVVSCDCRLLASPHWCYNGWLRLRDVKKTETFDKQTWRWTCPGEDWCTDLTLINQNQHSVNQSSHTPPYHYTTVVL